MKRCENCKTTFSDSVNFCTECGQSLVMVTESPHQSDTEAPIPKQKKKKKRSIWRVILTIIIVLVVGFVALVNYLMNAATYLRVEPYMLVADKRGGEAIVDIDYDGYIWVINHIPDWIEVEEYEQSFSVNVEPNLTGYNREGSITVQSGKLLAQLIIQQKGQATYIKTDKSSMHFNKSGHAETLVIDTDGCNYTVEYPDFLTISLDGDEINIMAGANYEEYRSGYLKIIEDNVSTRVHITQGGVCNNCHGSGRISCSQCMGRGQWTYGMFYSQCMFCQGVGSWKCNVCKGTGERE